MGKHRLLSTLDELSKDAWEKLTSERDSLLAENERLRAKVEELKRDLREEETMRQDYEEICGEYRAKNERLRAMLLTTDDGEGITVGTRVFWHSLAPETAETGYVVSKIDTTLWTVDFRDPNCGGPGCIPDDVPLYSSREAAEAAKEKDNG